MQLDLKDDLKFLRTNWKVERVGWGCILLIVLAGLAGLMGRGPLGNKTVSQGALKVQYDNVMRRSAPATIVVHVNRDIASVSDNPSSLLEKANDTTVIVWTSLNLYKGCEPESIKPDPMLISTTDDGILLTMSVVPNTTSTTFTFLCKPTESGRYRGFIGLAGGPQVPISIFVLP